MITHEYKGFIFQISVSEKAKNGWAQYACNGLNGEILWMNAQKLETFTNALNQVVDNHLKKN